MREGIETAGELAKEVERAGQLTYVDLSGHHWRLRYLGTWNVDNATGEWSAS